MDDELELELELLVHEVTANLDPVHTKYRNAYIFICLALLSTQHTKHKTAYSDTETMLLKKSLLF